MPVVHIMAGPNGAGKSTCARELLADTRGVFTFVNADVIAQGLAGFRPESAALEAGRVMLERLHELAEQRVDFAFEATLAGRSYVRWLQKLHHLGYGSHLNYIWLHSPELAIQRVAMRVQAGGHDIPDKTLRQPYDRSIQNLFGLYIPVCSTWRCYDNSQPPTYRLIAEGAGTTEVVYQSELWDKMIFLGKPRST